MKFLARLFGGEKGDEAELMRQAEDFVGSMEDLLNRNDDVKYPLKLYRKTKRFDRIIGEGGALHERFLRIALDIVARERAAQGLPVPKGGAEEIQPILYDVQTVIWDDELQDLGGLFQKAQSSEAEIVWVTNPYYEKRVDPLKKIRALYTFAASQKVVLGFLDDGIPMIIRRDFLTAAHGDLDKSIQMEDVGQALIDLAKEKSYESFNCWGR